jgi:diguanylate cyclase (GGDEF)-like protein/PAS domain S-box-containing protein
MTLRAAPNGLWDWNLSTQRVHFSPRWTAMVGSDGHRIGSSLESWLERVHPDDIGELRRQLHERLAGDASEFELPHRLLHGDGTYRWMACRLVIERDHQGRPARVIGSHSDITAERVTDPPTGLPNRLLFMEHLARAVSWAQRHPDPQFAVLLIDLGRPDRQANAPKTDRLLPAAARRLETCLSAGDGVAGLANQYLVARFRDDEFAILLQGLAEVGDAYLVAGRVLQAMLVPFTVEGDERFLPASIGIAVSATGYASADDVIRDAYTAVHRAKLMGRSRCEVFDTAILTRTQTERQLEIDFEKALDRREFHLAYQPVVSLSRGRIVGLEALMRWQHPVRGSISPGEFIPLAEQSGFIATLGEWCLREACCQLRHWQGDGVASKDTWVSVNLSSRQFHASTLIGTVAEALGRSGLPAQCLVVELTESTAMENPVAVKSLLMQLRALGVRVALDDFGTGQSSLAYLHQFPADKLKLDRAFIRDVDTRKDMRDIVESVTHLGHRLGLEVIAEGVETQEQLALVRSLACECVQGFIYSKPVSAERAAELLRSGFAAEPLATVTTPTPSAGGDRPSSGSQLPVARARASRHRWALAAALVTIALAGVVSRSPSFPEAPAQRAGQPAEQAQTRAPETIASAVPKPSVLVESVTSPPRVEPEQTRAATAMPSATRARQANRPATSLAVSVVHKHLMRGCKGQLVVTERGLSFLPEEPQVNAKDSFELALNQFSYSLSKDELSVKTGTRTYRFKSTARSRGQPSVADLGARLGSLGYPASPK